MSENNYPAYIPDIIIPYDEACYKFLSDFFSYKFIDLLKEEKTANYIKRIVEWKLCPNQNHKLYHSNCFNRKNNYGITLIRICHACKLMFIISGKFSTNYKYNKALNILNNPQLKNKSRMSSIKIQLY